MSCVNSRSTLPLVQIATLMLLACAAGQGNVATLKFFPVSSFSMLANLVPSPILFQVVFVEIGEFIFQNTSPPAPSSLYGLSTSHNFGSIKRTEHALVAHSSGRSKLKSVHFSAVP